MDTQQALVQVLADAQSSLDGAEGRFNFARPTLNEEGIAEVMSLSGVTPEEVVTVSFCQFTTIDHEGASGNLTVAFVHPKGILCTTGKRRLLGKAVKYHEISFASCRELGPYQYSDDTAPPNGLFGIAFAGPGGVLIGRLAWSWRGKRFRDSRSQAIAAAEERDRVLQTVNDLLHLS